MQTAPTSKPGIRTVLTHQVPVPTPCRLTAVNQLAVEPVAQPWQRGPRGKRMEHEAVSTDRVVPERFAQDPVTYASYMALPEEALQQSTGKGGANFTIKDYDFNLFQGVENFEGPYKVFKR